MTTPERPDALPEGYDTLNAEDAAAVFASLQPDSLADAIQYEQATKGRSTVLKAAAAQVQSASDAVPTYTLEALVAAPQNVGLDVSSTDLAAAFAHAEMDPDEAVSAEDARALIEEYQSTEFDPTAGHAPLDAPSGFVVASGPDEDQE